MKIQAILPAICCMASAASAVDIAAPARLSAQVVEDRGRFSVPIGPFVGEQVPALTMTGALRTRAWMIPLPELTLEQLAAPVQAQLEADGYRLGFSCNADQCGGFDFRFGIDVLPAPDMHVNLRAFRFATFLRGDDAAPDAAVTVLASTTDTISFLQVTEVSTQEALPAKSQTPGPQAIVPRVPAPSTAPVPTSGLGGLVDGGSTVLDGLEFNTGATTLGDGPFAVLSDLAQFLTANPNTRIALVGHTDTVGSLDGNIRISKQRAQAVRQRLIDGFDVPAAQIDAEGMGYLAPRASNLTEQGREANRRVEVILLPGG